MDNLKEQLVNISKAHAYDILVQQVQELKQVINNLIIFGELESFEFTDQDDTDEFQALVKKAKILSFTINT